MSSNTLNPFFNFFRATSLRVRLTALFITIFGATLIVFSVCLYRVFVRNHQTEFDAFLYNYAIDLKYSINVDLLGDVTLGPDILADRQKVFPFALGETFLQIRSDTGEVLAQSRNLENRTTPLPLPPDALKRLKTERILLETIPNGAPGSMPGNQEYRMLVLAFDKPGQGDYVLQVVVPMKLLQTEKQGLQAFFAGFIPFAMLVASLGGLFISRRALRPITDIVAKTREIQAHQLSERVPVPVSKDEVAQLALTLNELLNRLEQAFQAQEAFIADASHQLKTPLSILRGEIDWMAKGSRNKEDVDAFFVSASQEVDYLSKMVEDLLLLARTDAGPDCLSIDCFRFDERLLEAMSRLERLAASKNIRLSLDLTPLPPEESSGGNSFEMRGDGPLMRCLIENLVENAIKYAPAGSTVTLEVKEEAHDLKFVVEDCGPGFPSETAPKLFNRFYRAARNSASGSGLGLAIVKRIAELHQGLVLAENIGSEGTKTGARFTATMPKGISRQI